MEELYAPFFFEESLQRNTTQSTLSCLRTMMIYFIFALLWAFHTRLAASKGPPSTGLLPLPRGILATSTLDTTPRLRRSLSEHGIRQRDTVTYSNTTTLDMTLENAVLFFMYVQICGSPHPSCSPDKTRLT